MSRFYRTARGRVSNAGDMPRFVGLLPCRKADGGVLVFSSISELRVAEYLAWSPGVKKIAFESQKFEFEGTADLPAVTCWPDFEAVLDGGEIEWIEAKHSEDSLSEKAKARLTLIAAHCERYKRRYRVVYRKTLEENGFSATISLLRRYGELSFSDEAISRATRRLSPYQSTYLDNWCEHALSERVPIDLLYHLLYQQRLPVLYQSFMHTELQRCRS